MEAARRTDTTQRNQINASNFPIQSFVFLCILQIVI
jgi:hypothetical protein